MADKDLNLIYSPLHNDISLTERSTSSYGSAYASNIGEEIITTPELYLMKEDTSQNKRDYKDYKTKYKVQNLVETIYDYDDSINCSINTQTTVGGNNHDKCNYSAAYPKEVNPSKHKKSLKNVRKPRMGKVEFKREMKHYSDFTSEENQIFALEKAIQLDVSMQMNDIRRCLWEQHLASQKEIEKRMMHISKQNEVNEYLFKVIDGLITNCKEKLN